MPLPFRTSHNGGPDKIFMWGIIKWTKHGPSRKFCLYVLINSSAKLSCRRVIISGIGSDITIRKLAKGETKPYVLQQCFVMIIYTIMFQIFPIKRRAQENAHPFIIGDTGFDNCIHNLKVVSIGCAHGKSEQDVLLATKPKSL